MAGYNGSGTWTLSAGLPYVTGTTISSSTANTLNTTIKSGFDTAFCRDGQATATANWNLGSFKITTLGAATALTDASRYDQVQNSAALTLSSVAGTNTITGTATPTPAAYVGGQVFRFIPAATNTGATTLNVSSLGAGAVNLNGAACVGGEIVSGVPIEVYVSTSTPVFNILSPLAPRFKVGAFTRDTSTASGDQSVTGIGFKPKAIVFLAAVSGTTSQSTGFDDGSSKLSTYDDNPTATGSYAVTGNFSIALIFPSNPAITYTGVIASFDADGFTVTWTKTGLFTGTATIGYLAIR